MARGDLARRARRASPAAGASGRARVRYGRRSRPGDARCGVRRDRGRSGGARGREYRRVEFERLDEPPGTLSAVVASTSLHHVADPVQVLDGIAGLLAPGGRVVVLEWDWEAFDEPTAEWCFERLRAGEDGWLHRHRNGWAASGGPWSAYLRGWADEHGIHGAALLLGLLGERFRLERPAYGPYLFADLAGTTEADEQAAIDAGEIRATRVQAVGRRP